MKVVEAANALSVSKQTILNWLNSGFLVGNKISERKWDIDGEKVLYLQGGNFINQKSRFWDVSFFKNITEKSAYWAGFLIADGSVCCNGNNCKVDTFIQESDRCHIEMFCEDLLLDKKYIKTYAKRYSGNRQKLVGMSISSSHLRSELYQFGIVPNKSNCYVEPNIDLAMWPHFIRGWFDGDGNIDTDTNKKTGVTTGKWSIAGRMDALGFVSDKMRQLGYQGHIGIYHKRQKPVYGSLYICGIKNITAIYNILYGQLQPRLNRKWLKIETIINQE